MDRTVYCTFEVTVKATTDTDAASLRALATVVTAAYAEAAPRSEALAAELAERLTLRTGQPVSVVASTILHHWRADNDITAENKAHKPVNPQSINSALDIG